MFTDPRRLYAPGWLYHIVERKPFRTGRFPPVVRTAVPVDGRFEHLVISCNAMSDHGIIWIERESQKAFDIMMDRDRIRDVPAKQRMERKAVDTARSMRLHFGKLWLWMSLMPSLVHHMEHLHRLKQKRRRTLANSVGGVPLDH